MSRPKCTAEEIVQYYEDGLLNYLHFVHVAEPTIDDDNVHVLLELLPADQQREFVATYSKPDFGCTSLVEFGLTVPDADTVSRIHAALRAWLKTHPDQRGDAALGFE